LDNCGRHLSNKLPESLSVLLGRKALPCCSGRSDKNLNPGSLFSAVFPQEYCVFQSLSNAHENALRAASNMSKLASINLILRSNRAEMPFPLLLVNGATHMLAANGRLSTIAGARIPRDSYVPAAMKKFYRRPLSIRDILAWADAHHAAVGRWPIRESGGIPGAMQETWHAVDAALRAGIRGLPGGSSLAQLLAEKRNVRNIARLPPLTETLILAWADAQFAATGTWPTAKSGSVRDLPCETWHAVNAALQLGARGLSGGASLARLLATHRGVRNRKGLPPRVRGLCRGAGGGQQIPMTTVLSPSLPSARRGFSFSRKEYVMSATRLSVTEVPIDYRRRLGIKLPRQQTFRKEGVWSWALKTLVLLAELTQDQRRRVLEHAIKVNRF
jgi:hypothetical protein